MMRDLKVDANNPDAAVMKEATDVLARTGVIVYPTDTVYGIGCVLERECVRRVYGLKGRDFGSPLSVVFPNLEEVRHYTDVSPEQEEYVRREHMNGTTFILEKRDIPDYVTAGLNTVGVRIPDNRVCQALTDAVGPIVSTSANPSGEKAPDRVGEIEDSITEGVDLVLDAGPCRYGRPSRIIDLTRGFKVLRD